MPHPRCGEPIRTWGNLGLDGEWKDRPIALYGWERSRTPSVLFRELVLDDGEFCASLHPQPTSSSIVQAVGADPAGIGYASIFFRTRRTRPLPLEGLDGRMYTPSPDNCQGGKYPLARFLFVYANKSPSKPLDPLTAEFLRFVLSRQGQQVVCDGGNFPLSAEVAAIQSAIVVGPH